MSQENNLQDLLSAVTDSLITGDERLDALYTRHGISRGTIDPEIALIRRLDAVFVPMQPSPKFSQRLKGELMGGEKRGLIARVRYLPARVQMAAGVVAAAGFVLFIISRVSALAGQNRKRETEIISTQQ